MLKIEYGVRYVMDHRNHNSSYNYHNSPTEGSLCNYSNRSSRNRTTTARITHND
jgi:hypothetical protein